VIVFRIYGGGCSNAFWNFVLLAYDLLRVAEQYAYGDGAA
jgi:hypothetical protein